MKFCDELRMHSLKIVVAKLWRILGNPGHCNNAFPRVCLACFLRRESKLSLTKNFNWEYCLCASYNVHCMIFMWIDCICWVQKLLYADEQTWLPNLEGVAYFGRYEWKWRTSTFAESSVCLFHYLFERQDKMKLGSSIQIYIVDKNSD